MTAVGAESTAGSPTSDVAGRPSFLETWHRPKGWRLVVMIGALGVFLASAAILVYATGGTRFSPVHVVYVAILGAALLFGAPGGIATGIVAGLLVGPLMPLDTEQNSRQEVLNWIIRTGFFAMIGGMAGVTSSILVRQLHAIRRNGLYDSLTGLPNRSALLHRLGEMLDKDGPAPRSVALVHIGVADLNAIVAAVGHRHADSLIHEIARRIQQVAGSDTPVFDLGNDRFGLLFVDRSLKHVVRRAQSIVNVLDDPIVVDNVPILVEGHAAIARYPEDAADAASLQRAAGAALEDAIIKRRPYALYDRTRDEIRRRGAALLPELQAELRSGSNLALHYQPKVSLLDGRCLGVEALLRWTHPTYGAVPPGDFIPLAENTTLLRPLTNWVLMAACRQVVDWRARGLRLSTAINISVRNLEDETFVDGMIARLESLNIDPGLLEIEVTESALTERMGDVRGALVRLREHGVRVALDDFGTGQSSLAYLRDFPIDIVKLDRAFVHDLVQDGKKQVIVGKSIEIARRLGFDVVAEGIEDEETAAELRTLDCEVGQGYLYARPQPAPELAGWLESRCAS